MGVSPLIAKLLVRRGISTPQLADAFLDPCFSHMPDAFLLPDAEVAAERLKVAINGHEKIIIHGDYDGDGVTSAALWMRLLEKLNADVTVHVPHRKLDGYDIRSKFVQEAKSNGVKLIVTTDCGIQRLEEVEEAREAGIDVIVTDHHEPGESLPKAVAVVNPHRKDSIYPFQDLAGVGVSFRMGEALIRHLNMPVDGYRKAYCDYAAIGTVTDVMPIIAENRVFVKYGLESIRNTKKPGLKALMSVSGITPQNLNASSIGFRMGPRINAIGRLADASLALDLLLTRDDVEAANLAQQLETANKNRQGEQQRIFEEAIAQVAQIDLNEVFCLALGGESWHSGVIGIVASKIVEYTGRPTIMVALDKERGIGRASARSIHAFNMLEAITKCGDLLLEFGGHSHAAGFGIMNERFAEFAKRIDEVAHTMLTEDDFIPELIVDAEINSSDLNEAMINEISVMEPFGRGNPEPLFIVRNLAVSESFRMGTEKQHLKLRLKADGDIIKDAILWGAGVMADSMKSGDRVDVVCRPQLNHFNGRTTVQLLLEDIKVAGT